ncbi:MAG: hypothetical protein RIT45_129 [Pseudomonadota bacterium]|jgi:cytochrome c-type biogenesis protein CcmF
MHHVGTALLQIAFAVTLVSSLASMIGARWRSSTWLEVGRQSMLGAWLLWLAMSAALVYGLVTHDFSNKYIAAYTDRDMPFAYLLAGFWGGEKGALLFWTAVLSTFSVVSIGRNKTQDAVFLGWTTAILQGAILFFAALMVYESDPFEIFQSHYGPDDGKGMNPLLQNPFMSIHPPSMLTGYMTFTVPFAFGAAALITGKLDAQWIRDTRRWTLVSWMFLTIGLILGGAWAYQELGWGGFWMWDPVENAGLIPWFTATAFLHSVMIQERRNMLRRWNAVLVCLTFLLTIFGTFLTRSQLIDSVHAFADSTLAPWFLWYMGFIFVLSVALVGWRWNALRAEADLDSLWSREAFFVLNNVLLVGCAFVVIWGTLFSKISEAEAFRALYNGAVGGLSALGLPIEGLEGPVQLGEAWFNRVMTPLGLLLLLLTGIGPLISWRRSSRRNFERNFARPLSYGSFATLVLVLAWSARSLARAAEAAGTSMSDALPGFVDALGRTEFFGVLAVWFSVFVFVTILIEFHVGTMARVRSKGEGYLLALVTLTLRNKRRYGGYIVHLGIVFAFIAFTGNAFRIYRPEVALEPGDRTDVGQYGLVHSDAYLGFEPDGAYVWQRARVHVLERDEQVPSEHVEAVRALATGAGSPPSRVEALPGSAKLAVVFADDGAARRFAEPAFARRLAETTRVLPSEDPTLLMLDLGDEALRVARVAPRMVMSVFKEARTHFELRSSLQATVKTVPGQSRFEIRFASAEDRSRFVGWMRAPAAEAVQWMRYNDKASQAGAAIVDLVPRGVGLLLEPEIRFYQKHSSPTTEVAIESTFEHDLYLAMRPQQGTSFITLLAIVFPFVGFLWLGAITMVLGGAISMWPTGATVRAPVAAARPPRAAAAQPGPADAAASPEAG